MQFTPYLTFDGRCEEAFARYHQIFGGEIVAMMTYASSPMADQTAPEFRDKIMHANLTTDGFQLMASDAPPGRFHKAEGTMVSVAPATAEEGHRVFDALAEGGTVTMPAQATFWASLFGMVTDRFGTPWMVNVALPG